MQVTRQRFATFFNDYKGDLSSARLVLITLVLASIGLAITGACVLTAQAFLLVCIKYFLVAGLGLYLISKSPEVWSKSIASIIANKFGGSINQTTSSTTTTDTSSISTPPADTK